MLQDYLRQYAILAIFLGIAIVVPIGMLTLSLVASRLRIRPSRPTRVKRIAYESGLPPMSGKPTLFGARYSTYAILFVVFDVETIFVYPWAVRYGVMSREFGFVALGAMLVFLGVLTVPYLYAWRKRALEWQ